VSESVGVSSGHEEFAALALEYFDVLYNAAMALTRHHADAQDLVQETYLKAYRFWHRFEPGTNVRAWLLTILRHAFINAYRKTARQQARNDVDDRVPAWAETPWFPACTDRQSLEEMLRHVVQDEVKQALDELSEEFRLVVLLADLEECSYQDIATIIGCPVGTVMSRLCRGRKQLRKRLEAFARASGYLRASPPEAMTLKASRAAALTPLFPIC
jgi:RNA polymerase sigma-70 factor (ECF subfamily)